MVRITRVYTKGGDAGDTSLVGGDRVRKSALRIESYGTVDELNATLGVVRTVLKGSAAAEELLPIVVRVQNELFNLGAELATPRTDPKRPMNNLSERHVVMLESDIDRLNADLPELQSFILPGGGMVAAQLHVARTTCRRAERVVIRLLDSNEVVPPLAVRYLNRLSDALFVFGRYAAKADGEAEPLWRPEDA